jgi:hypothetical protein
MTKFTDPDNTFTIGIPKGWKYNTSADKSNKNLHQFEVGPNVVFQIAVYPVNERISQLIADRELIQHDYSLPDISFVETFSISDPMELYNWSALVGDKFINASFFYEAKTKDRKYLGLELFEIRIALRNIVLLPIEKQTKPCPGFVPMDEEVDHMDINFWRDKPLKYLQSIGSKKKYKTTQLSSLEIDPIQLYGLLTAKISQQPNGFFDLVKVGQPLDNTIWWDFVLECDKEFIQIWRTPFILEALYYFDGQIDVQAFFQENIKRYKNVIDEQVKTFERHTIYINHYQSYSGCVETLWREIKTIDLTIPKAPRRHLTESGETENYKKTVETFLESSVRYHALAKSLVLNAAFKIESFLNLIIRIGSLPEMKLYPDVLSKFLKQEFAYRVKNIGFYSQILTGDIDMGSNVYRETKNLMNLRNKYVHYEEDAIHNRLGEILYDRDYPLHPIEEHRPAIDAAIKTFHQPDLKTVRNAYKTANDFVAMVENLFPLQMAGKLKFLISQNPIGYNESKSIYSAVYNPMAVDFFTGMGDDKKPKKRRKKDADEEKNNTDKV